MRQRVHRLQAPDRDLRANLRRRELRVLAELRSLHVTMLELIRFPGPLRSQ